MLGKAENREDNRKAVALESLLGEGAKPFLPTPWRAPSERTSSLTRLMRRPALTLIRSSTNPSRTFRWYENLLNETWWLLAWCGLGVRFWVFCVSKKKRDGQQ